MILLVVSVMGCARFHVRVDSYSSPNPPMEKTYRLLSGDENISNEDLQFQEFSQYIHAALEKKGYIPVEENPRYAIFMMYGISTPMNKTVSMPTYGQTGVSSSHTFGTISSYGNYGTFSGMTTYRPTYGITGYVPVTVSNYSRYLALDAYDTAEYESTNELKEVWKTIVTSTGSSGDLRSVFPVLVGASAEYWGTNTGKQVSITITESNKKIVEVKESVSNP